MHLILELALGAIALVWVVQGTRAIRGMAKLPRLADVTPLPDTDCPSVSILVAARDEAAKLPRAVATLLAQDYPRYEVIAVDDRSRDATPHILDEFSQKGGNLKVIHIADLPKGWLGKPHALSTAYQEAVGDWLVFADADVRFAPDLLRRALALALEKQWDHLTLVGLMDLAGFWEKTAITYLGLGFTLGVEAWRVSDPHSRRYLGMGYFQLLRRSAYNAVGTHSRLAMEVVDDMKLGKLVKLGGFHSGVAIAEEGIRLRWYEGLGGIVQGSIKNAFAFDDYSVLRVVERVLAILAVSLLPSLAFLLSAGLTRLLAAVSVIVALTVHAWCARKARVSWLYGFTHPIGACIMCYILLHATFITLWQGGVVWRDTFYSLKELRKGLV
jgi:glycosyltransferase involved in cell wall biosynthesis